MSINQLIEENYPQQKAIHSYVRDRQNRRVGVLAAVTNPEQPETVFIGWSRCNRSMGDRFDPVRGTKIALDRSYRHKGAGIPFTMLEQYNEFRARCEKYFRGKNVA